MSMNRGELMRLLLGHNIPVGTWGTGKAKTFEHLFAEVTSEEVAVEVEEAGGQIFGTVIRPRTVRRTVYGSIVRIYYDDGETSWKLVEQKQVFKDGRLRPRSLQGSIGEKLKRNELPETAARRAMAEELGITEPLSLDTFPPIIKGPLPSDSYPGLESVYYMHIFEVYLPTHLYKPEGYIEHQEDKDNYFVWKKD